MSLGTDLLPTLRRYWGYDSFRPLQEEIARSLLEGHDTCVVMPTGGGKSLCYQLPAAMLLEQTVMVVSPLIALMQDQVAQLTQMGIASAVLNSSVVGNEQSSIMSRACKGEYRLFYLSPERLARTDTIAWLRQVPLSFFVVDEAHCISEWGHEFRPDYRQLSSLRLHFPDRPIAAFTASATRRVRHDIIDQLQLRNPDKYIASFHRPNLRYVVKECEGHTQLDLLVTALRHYSGSIIVYSPTIARVEETVDFLEEQGIPAIAYHGQMESGVRRRNQERWMSDEIRVLVGTIAFGLGINKSAVRAVIHLSLPKSIEQYYQEAGRAGRDRLPADCILLWQKRDVGLLAHFIKQIADPAETGRAWQRYNDIRRFVESDRCRHSQICSHFGEKTKWKSCGACDVCGYQPEWLQQPVGVGRAKRTKAASPARALTTLRPPVKPTDVEPKRTRTIPPARALAALRLPVKSADKGGALNKASDLRDYLREWRRITANEQGVPAFIVMHDSSLEELCRKRPASLAELADVSGFGERKVELYGRPILDALARFRQGARAVAVPQQKTPAQETIRLLAEGRTFDEIAKIRGRQLRTIVSMVADLVARGEIEFQPAWVDSDRQKNIEAACAHLGLERLGPLKEVLTPEITYEDIRLVVARLRRQHDGR